MLFYSLCCLNENFRERVQSFFIDEKITVSTPGFVSLSGTRSGKVGAPVVYSSYIRYHLYTTVIHTHECVCLWIGIHISIFFCVMVSLHILRGNCDFCSSKGHKDLLNQLSLGFPVTFFRMGSQG